MEVAPQGIASRRTLALRLGVLCGAVALGLVGQQMLGAHLVQIETLSRTDLLGARAELARVLEVSSVVVFGLTGGVGVALLASLRRGLALGQFPPPGLLSWGARQRLTGSHAALFTRVGMALALTLVLASCAGGALVWHMAAVLRACRSGV